MERQVLVAIIRMIVFNRIDKVLYQKLLEGGGFTCLLCRLYVGLVVLNQVGQLLQLAKVCSWE